MKRGLAVDEWEVIPLSRLSHASFCLRRAALLTNEQLWNENADTAKGRQEHEKVHTERIERRGDRLMLYEYEVVSEKMGIGGKCDCVEAVRDESGCRIPAADFPVKLYPIEYKHGKLREEESYEIQLCAQAMCLEEMYETEITEGAVFYISSHRRKAVMFTDALRQKVIETVCLVDDIRKNFTVPPAISGPRCKRCSLRELCLPDLQTSAKSYCNRMTREAMEVTEI